MNIGLSFTSTEKVDNKNVASALGSGDLSVYATPAMAALMENAAMKCVASYLPERTSTVGSFLEITHERPSGIGETISASAELLEIDGRKLTFSVVAKDSKGVIGKGRHIRYIIDVERFLAKI